MIVASHEFNGQRGITLDNSSRLFSGQSRVAITRSIPGHDNYTIGLWCILFPSVDNRFSWKNGREWGVPNSSAGHISGKGSDTPHPLSPRCPMYPILQKLLLQCWVPICYYYKKIVTFNLSFPAAIAWPSRFVSNISFLLHQVQEWIFLFMRSRWFSAS